MLYLKSLFIHFLFTFGLSTSWHIMAGLTGQYSFGHGLFFGVSAYLSMFLFNTFPYYFLGGLPFVLVLTGSIGASIAYLSFRFKVEHAYFTLLTLVCLECFRMIFENLTVFNGMSGFFLITSDFSETISSYFLYILLFFVFAIFGFTFKLFKSDIALKSICLKDSVNAALSIGIHPIRHPTMLMFLSAFFISCLGALSIFYKKQLFPDQVFSMQQSMYMVLPALIGGVGKVSAPLIGSVIWVVLNELIDHLLDYFDVSIGPIKHIIFGFIILLIVNKKNKVPN
ncbi:MAG: branched-chain amino acid ABC transporter permease [Proteobacteria bacterium]|nr:branched-chain amino acid ABC transporter permease [Pseudomonadota bacterium]